MVHPSVYACFGQRNNSLNSSDCINWIFLTLMGPSVASVALDWYGITDNLNGVNPFRSEKLTLSTLSGAQK